MVMGEVTVIGDYSAMAKKLFYFCKRSVPTTEHGTLKKSVEKTDGTPYYCW
jgi:hypothetical protein